MAEIATQALHIGRANIVLVLGQGDHPPGVISSVVVRACEQTREDRLHFSGPVPFEEKTAKHIKDVVLPTADSILKALNLSQKCFDIFVANLGAASINDISFNITKFSADVSVLLAILSACLEIAVPVDLVFTGHIASIDGDIRMVRGIPAKLEAAVAADSISTFVHPALDQDSSLDSLSPGEKQRVEAAISNAKRNIRTVAVRDIGELVREVFPDEQIVLGSLRQGFYRSSIRQFAKESPIGRAANFFTWNNEQRFWTVLERQLLEGRNENARELLEALAYFYIQRKTYPKGLGWRLIRLVQSLPPETRRLKIAFPLLPMSECIQLSQFAHESEHDDVLHLFKATSGKIAHLSVTLAEGKESNLGTANERQREKLVLILSEIDADALTSIGLPIDEARATYVLDSVTVKTYDEFIETITSFYIHLMRHTRKVSDPVDINAAGAEAFELLERAFAKNGGYQAAFAETQHATNGGLRLILDLMTEQFKREEKEKHVNHVLKSVMDPLDWEGKVALMAALIKRLELHLPPKIISQPAERFTGHCETLVKAYVQSIDQVKSLFRSL